MAFFLLDMYVYLKEITCFIFFIGNYNGTLWKKNLNVKYAIYGGRNTHQKGFFLLKIEKGFHVSLSCGKILQIFLSPHHATLYLNLP